MTWIFRNSQLCAQFSAVVDYQPESLWMKKKSVGGIYVLPVAGVITNLPIRT